MTAYRISGGLSRAAPDWREEPAVRVELNTTLPRSLMPWRDHLQAGLEMARTRPATWTIYRDAYRLAPPPPGSRPEPDIAKRKLLVAESELRALERCQLAFGAPLDEYELELTAAQARQLAHRHPALTPAPGRRRLFLYPVGAPDADQLAHRYGSAAAKRARAHPADPRRRVLPLAQNETISCALYCARNAGLPARQHAVASLDDALHAYLMLDPMDRQAWHDALGRHPAPASAGNIVPASVLPDGRPLEPSISADRLQAVLEDADRQLMADPTLLERMIAAAAPTALLP